MNKELPFACNDCGEIIGEDDWIYKVKRGLVNPDNTIDDSRDAPKYYCEECWLSGVLR